MVLNLFHFIIIEATVLMGTLKALETVLYAFSDLCFATLCYYGGLPRVPWTAGLCFAPRRSENYETFVYIGVYFSKLENTHFTLRDLSNLK